MKMYYSSLYNLLQLSYYEKVFARKPIKDHMVATIKVGQKAI